MITRIDNVLREIDRWIGKTMFIPIIIRLCQMMGITQYVFADYATLLANTLLILSLRFDHLTSYIIAFFVIFQTGATLYRLSRPALQHATRYSPLNETGLRLLCAVGFIYFVVRSIRSPVSETICMTGALAVVLFELYALTIDTIPPRSLTKTKTVSKAV